MMLSAKQDTPLPLTLSRGDLSQFLNGEQSLIFEGNSATKLRVGSRNLEPHRPGMNRLRKNQTLFLYQGTTLVVP
jgi:hypothetical protein